MKTRSLTYVLLIAIFLGLANTGLLAQEETSLPKGIVKVTSIEGITEYRLDNGLRVLLYPDATKPTAIVNIVYLVGSRHENYGETGMAHLLEHMVFKGTPTNRDIPAQFSRRGFQSNGQTNVDRTNYYEQFAASDENLDWAISLEADRMINSFIAKKDLDSEMTVVRNEMERGENSPGAILNQKISATAYQWHNYGKTTIGARSDVENVPIDRLQAFYRTYYQPDNAVLLIGGKIDVDKTLAMIAKHFGPIPRPTRQLPQIYTLEPTQDGERSVTLRRTGTAPLIAAAYHIPSILHEDTAPLSVLGQIMSAQPEGPLYKALVETKKVNSASGRPSPNTERGLFYFSSTLSKDQNVDAARTALLETVENYSKTPPSEQVVASAREVLVKNVDNQRTDVLMFMGAIMTGYVGNGDWRMYYLFRERLKKVTAADVQRVAAKYFVPSNRTVGTFIPTESPVRAEIPNVTTDELAGWFKDFKGGEAVVSGEEFDPTPENIESRLKRITTPSGIELALLPKKTRGEKVNAIVSLYLGNEKALMNRKVAGMMAAGLLMRGSANYDRKQIADELNRIKTRAGIGGEATRSGANLDSTRENLIPALRLAAEVLRNPNYRAEDFEELRRSYISGYQNQLSDPQRLGDNWLERHLSKFPAGDIRAAASPEEMIAELKRVTLDDVKQFHRDFYGASAARISIVGDFDEKAVVPVIEELFGDWKNKIAFEPAHEVYFDVPGASKVFETPDKANAYFAAALNMKLGQTDPDYPAMFIGNYILGGSGLSSRITKRIRGKEGLSYGVRSTLTVDLVDQVALFKASAIVAPENVARLEVIFNEELALILKDGVTADELAAAKSGFLQQRMLGRTTDNALANKLRDYLLIDRTLLWDAEFEKAVGRLTVEQVNAALRKYLVPSKLSVVKAGDFAKLAQR